MRAGGKLGLEVTVDDTGRRLVVTKIFDGGPAALDGRLRIGDSLVSVHQLSPESWISSHTGSPEPVQTLESVIAALKDASGPWVCEVMRRGCDDVLQVEIACGVRGKNGASDAHEAEHSRDLFGAAAIQKNLWEQLMQATAPNQASWQTKAARVGMPGFGGEFKEHTWEEVWEGPDDEPEADKLRDPETGLLLQYGTDAQAHKPESRVGRLPCILGGLGAGALLCIFLHFLPFVLPAIHMV